MAASNFNELRLRQLAKSVQLRTPIPIDKLGQRIKDIREAMGMTQSQMAKKLKVKQPVISRIEENISSSRLTTVIRILGALECEFMGVIIAETPIEKIIERQARKTAKRMLSRTYANMAMEKQAPKKQSYEIQLERLSKELAGNPGPELWEE